MTFRSTSALWLLASVPIIVLFLSARERMRLRIARRFVSERLRGVANGVHGLRPWLYAAGLAAAFIAYAGPRAGYTLVPVTERETNRIIALDVSNSMGADDVAGSRLEAAKAIVRRLIDAAPGRVALIEFEARGEVVSPLTNDGDAVAALLDSTSTGDVSDPGSDIGAALMAALKMVESDPASKADVVIISDGEDQGSHVREAIAKAKAIGVPVSTVVVGSAQGSTIPLPAGAKLRDDSGQVVTTYAHSDVLESIASSTGGVFLENPFAANALDPLLNQQVRGAAKQRNVRVPVDRFQWPLALAFAALLCGSLANRGAE
ncbi:MAG: VWA domain-containing protein [Thermoanaerobaculia bacterium]